MFPGKIFTNNQSSATVLPTTEAFMNSDLRYEISDTISSLMEAESDITVSHMRSTYQYLKENNIVILEEGFDDFLHKVNEFFKKMKDAIVTFFKKTVMYIQSAFMDFEKFIHKYKDKIESVNREFTYENGFEYTINHKDSPNISIVDDVIKEFNEMISSTDKLTKDFINTKRTDFNNEENKNKMRAKILKGDSASGEIPSDAFIAEVKKFYRDGAEHPKKITVNNAYLRDITSKYGEIKKLLNDTKVERDKILSSLEKMKAFFNNKVRVVYNNASKTISTSTLNKDNKHIEDEKQTYNYDKDLLARLNNYYQLQYSKTSFMYTCITNVYFEKIRAIQGCLKQYQTIVKYAIFNKGDSVEEKETTKESDE